MRAILGLMRLNFLAVDVLPLTINFAEHYARLRTHF